MGKTAGMPPDPLLNTIVAGRYQLVRRLGDGGMGVVYEGKHVVIGRRVAVKMLHPHLVADESQVERFLNEARAAASLGHPHIIECLDAGITDAGLPFLALAFLEGRSLVAEMEAVGPMSVARSVNITLQAADALASAHDQNIVHRDIKPDNLYLTDQPGHPDFVTVLDFGIARFRSGQLAATAAGTVMGTPSYMPPEQIIDASAVGVPADIYALGVTLYEMLSGRLPFEGDSLAAIAIQIAQQEPPDLTELRPDIPRELVEAIERALAKDPEDRWPDMASFSRAIAPFAGTDPPSARPSSAMAAAAAANVQRQRTTAPVQSPFAKIHPLALVGVAAFAVVVLGGFWFVTRDAEPALAHPKKGDVPAAFRSKGPPPAALPPLATELAVPKGPAGPVDAGPIVSLPTEPILAAATVPVFLDAPFLVVPPPALRYGAAVRIRADVAGMLGAVLNVWLEWAQGMDHWAWVRVHGTKEQVAESEKAVSRLLAGKRKIRERLRHQLPPVGASDVLDELHAWIDLDEALETRQPLASFIPTIDGIIKELSAQPPDTYGILSYAHYLRAMTLLNFGQAEEAQEEFKRAIDARGGPLTPELRYWQARDAVAHGRVAEAQEALSSLDASPEVLALRIDLHYLGAWTDYYADECHAAVAHMGALRGTLADNHLPFPTELDLPELNCFGPAQGTELDQLRHADTAAAAVPDLEVRLDRWRGQNLAPADATQAVSRALSLCAQQIFARPGATRATHLVLNGSLQAPSVKLASGVSVPDMETCLGRHLLATRFVGSFDNGQVEVDCLATGR